MYLAMCLGRAPSQVQRMMRWPGVWWEGVWREILGVRGVKEGGGVGVVIVTMRWQGVRLDPREMGA